MDKAKAAVSDFLGRAGHHDTTVHESVAPAVQNETIKSHQHENITTAVDKEVHQDHHHTTVQPVFDKEVLPEQHTHQVAGVEHRKFDNRDHDTTKNRLAQEAAQFKDTRHVEGTTKSQSVAPTVGGEHVHHHIHETIQPVINKETLQSNVVHTTVPVHEVHHNKEVHHGATTLPAMTMDQFKSKGGALEGREDRFDHFEGAPKGLETATGGLTGSHGTSGSHGLTGSHGTSGTSGTHGLTGSRDTSGGLTGSHGTSGGLTGSHGTTGTGGLTGSHGTTSGHGLTGTHGSTASGHTGGSHGGTDAALESAGGAARHLHGDRGAIGQGNLTGSSTQGGVLSSNTHQDNNLTSNRQDHSSSLGHGTSTGTGTTGTTSTAGHVKGVVEGITGHNKNEMSHRENEDGALPRALTEDKSVAVPHPDSRHGNEQV